MTQTPDTPPTDPKDGEGPKDGDRIAKVIARAGLASRREAERMITEGRVTVNGAVIYRAALNVTRRDKVTVDGKLLGAPDEPRLWLYHKPTGLVTTTKDEQGRETIYDAFPDDLPRVMTIGRLDLNSEGLLLLTNDGGIKRKLELPSTGWLRRYRVRVNGRPNEDTFEPLRKGLEVDGQRFLPMIVTIDRQQGANAWLTVGLREGKNREIRRAMTDLGLTVNRLIRVSYGPFQLGELEPGAVQEIRRRVMRDQLGMEPEDGEAPRKRVERMSRPRKPDEDGGAQIGGARGRPQMSDDRPQRSGFAGKGPRPDRSEGRPDRPKWAGSSGGPGGRPQRDSRDGKPEGRSAKPGGGEDFKGGRKPFGKRDSGPNREAAGEYAGKASARRGPDRGDGKSFGRSGPDSRAPGGDDRKPRSFGGAKPSGPRGPGGGGAGAKSGPGFGGGTRSEGFSGGPGGKPSGRSFGGAKPSGGGGRYAGGGGKPGGGSRFGDSGGQPGGSGRFGGGGKPGGGGRSGGGGRPGGGGKPGGKR